MTTVPFEILVLPAVFIALFGWAIWSGARRDFQDFGEIAAVTLGFAGIVMLTTVGSISFVDSLTDVRQLETFRDATIASYEYTIDETNRIVLTDEALTDFSDRAASDRIAELRDRVAWYNGKLAELSALNEIPFIRAIVADVGDLEPIILPRQP